VTAFWFGKAFLSQFGATAGARTDWVGNTIKCSLHTNTYVPAQDTDQFFSAATNEISGTGYSAGGVTLTTKTLTYDAASNEARLDADDASWTSATFSARNAVVYNSTPGTAATNPVMGYVNFGASDQSVSAGTFTIQWDATGVLKVTSA
jgi:hypothetical protein